MPTIGLEVGETYTFDQADRSNYFHPMGFAYGPDGAHAGAPELEPTVSNSDSRCARDASCPAPMYFLEDEYLGTYSNIRHVLPATTGENDFGLDSYEPLFFRPIPDWTSYGNFSIKLRFDDESHTDDLFYFCHVSKEFCFLSLWASRQWLTGCRPREFATDPPIHVGADQTTPGRGAH